MKKKSLIFLMLALVLSLCLALVACADKNGGVKKLTAESGITADGVFESGSAVSIPTAMAASGKLTPTSTGMNVNAEIRQIKRRTQTKTMTASAIFAIMQWAMPTIPAERSNPIRPGFPAALSQVLPLVR